MQFGLDAQRIKAGEFIRLGIVDQSPGRTFACLVDWLCRIRDQARKIKGVGLETDNRYVAACLRTALDRSVLHHQQRETLHLDNVADLGFIGEDRRRIAGVMQQKTVQRAVTGAVADMECQTVGHGNEAAGLDDVGHEIDADAGDFIAQPRQSLRSDVERHGAGQKTDAGREDENRTEHQIARASGGIDDNQLAVTRQGVQDEDQGNHQRERRHDDHQKRHRQHRDRNELDDGLTLGRDQIQLAQGLRCPHHAGHGRKCHREDENRPADDVTFECLHSLCRTAIRLDCRPVPSDHGN